MERAVFLDRDGVINRVMLIHGKPHPPSSFKDLEILPDVPEATRKLRAAGYRLLVATNQPDVRTGKQQRHMVEAIHEILQKTLELDDVFVCYHTDADRCACRKPLPGMLLAGARRWNIDLSQSFMVGDRWRDVDAGRAAGCRTFWVRGEEYLERAPENPTWTVRSLLEAAHTICSLQHSTSREAA